MTTSPIETITDELLAELEEECALAAELDINAAVVPAHITALLSHIADLKQQLVAASITAENCELFRKDAERAYIQGLKDQKGNFEKAYSSTDCWTMCENKTSDGLRAMDAAIDAARSSGGGS